MCVYVCAIVHICTRVCGSHRTSQVLFLRDHPPCLLSLSLSLASYSPSWSGWLVSKPQGPACLRPHKKGIASVYLHSQHFSMGSGDPTCAHACKVSSFLNKLSPQPSKAYLYGTHEELGRSSAGESGRGNQKLCKERGTRVLVTKIRTSGWHCLTEVRRTSALE